jgi:hypothetical protein
MAKPRIKQLVYHRNGVTSVGVWVAIVRDEGEDIVVVRFPKQLDLKAGGVLCAALGIDKLAAGDIGPDNKKRGDFYASIVDAAIAAKGDEG